METVTAFLGLGSNQGDRLANLRRAVRGLGDHPLIHSDPHSDLAPLYETCALGVPNQQDDYLNSVMRVSTTLSAEELLRVILDLERSMGRVRRLRWEPRIIDLDLLLFGDQVIRRDELTVPHARLAERRFVLEPLAEIAGAMMHPVLHVSLARLAENCRIAGTDQAIRRIADSNWAIDLGTAGVSPGVAAFPAG